MGCPNLSDELKNEILIRLPIKDAVRTSVLSRDWRFQWQNMSKLLFDINCIPLLNNQLDPLANYKLSRVIDSVLSHHVGSLEGFQLSTPLLSFLDVDRWIVILQRKEVKKVVLRFSGEKFYQVPSRLFNCHQLFVLSLEHCELKPSLCFAELRNLKSLYLEYIRDPGGRLEALIFSCPSLEFLLLYEIEGSNTLNLVAPCLQTLIITNVYFDIIICDAPGVNYLEFQLNTHYTNAGGGGILIANMLNCLLKLKGLELSMASLLWLFRGDHIPERLPSTYEHLEKLIVEIEFTKAEEFNSLLSLLRSFPNIKYLHLYAAYFEGRQNATGPYGLKDMTFALRHLQKVSLVEMAGTQQELLLLEYILANAPVLRTLEISMNTDGQVLEKSDIFIKLMRFPRASSIAEIVYKDELELPRLYR